MILAIIILKAQVVNLMFQAMMKTSVKFTKFYRHEIVNLLSQLRNQHNYNTSGSKERMIFKITQKTTTYGLNSIHHRAENDLNELLKNIRLEFDYYFSSKLTFTKTLKEYLLNKYI